MSKDYYQILGVDKGASKDDIKKAFRKLAHQYHPDKKGGDEAKFKEVNEAYSVLSDDSKRQQYDTFGSSAFNGGAGGFNGGQGFGGFDFSGFQNGQNGFEFDLGDIFSEFFGGGVRSEQRQRRGRDISIDIQISFREAVFGVERKILVTKTSKCNTCSGTGAKPGTGMKTCETCNGKGKIHETKKSFMGTFSTTRACSTCHGSGQVPKEKCVDCNGQGVLNRQQEIVVKIPPGMENGEMIRLSGAGEAVAGGVPGDLYIKVHVQDHPVFIKEGQNLIMELPIKITKALLGGEEKIDTLDGEITLKIPAGIAYDEILRVKNKGVPNEKGKRGDLLVRIDIVIPKKLSRNAEKLVEDLKREGL